MFASNITYKIHLNNILELIDLGGSQTMTIIKKEKTKKKGITLKC